MVEIVDVVWDEAPQAKVCDECDSDIQRGDRYGIYYECLAPLAIGKKPAPIVRCYCAECTELVIDSLTTDSYRPVIKDNIEATFTTLHERVQ